MVLENDQDEANKIAQEHLEESEDQSELWKQRLEDFTHAFNQVFKGMPSGTIAKLLNHDLHEHKVMKRKRDGTTVFAHVEERTVIRWTKGLSFPHKLYWQAISRVTKKQRPALFLVELNYYAQMKEDTQPEVPATQAQTSASEQLIPTNTEANPIAPLSMTTPVTERIRLEDILTLVDKFIEKTTERTTDIAVQASLRSIATFFPDLQIPSTELKATIEAIPTTTEPPSDAASTNEVITQQEIPAPQTQITPLVKIILNNGKVTKIIIGIIITIFATLLIGSAGITVIDLTRNPYFLHQTYPTSTPDFPIYDIKPPAIPIGTPTPPAQKPTKTHHSTLPPHSTGNLTDGLTFLARKGGNLI